MVDSVPNLRYRWNSASFQVMYRPSFDHTSVLSGRTYFVSRNIDEIEVHVEAHIVDGKIRRDVLALEFKAHHVVRRAIRIDQAMISRRNHGMRRARRDREVGARLGHMKSEHVHSSTAQSSPVIPVKFGRGLDVENLGVDRPEIARERGSSKFRVFHVRDRLPVDHHHLVIFLVIGIADLLLNGIVQQPVFGSRGIVMAAGDLNAKIIRQIVGVIPRTVDHIMQNAVDLFGTGRRDGRPRRGGGGGAATGRVADNLLIARRARMVRGPAPIPCNSSTRRSSSWSLSLIFLTNAAILTSSRCNWMEDLMNATT